MRDIEDILNAIPLLQEEQKKERMFREKRFPGIDKEKIFQDFLNQIDMTKDTFRGITSDQQAEIKKQFVNYFSVREKQAVEEWKKEQERQAKLEKSRSEEYKAEQKLRKEY